ncbi:hypothetical protein RND71_003808 [Anisodus tanguticus]|uniref:Uncharacterized protein n=1 Tax=Anisodus tanguticus TaxID=243964 RepID=A0AAE1VQB5_9SOLA|nr:hypothetical protein RND71_003808 [Anisodus tanguticus]
MAKKLDDCEFCLPSQFLTDDDLFVDFKVKNDVGKYLGRDFGPGFNPFGPHSDLTSPVESVIGSVDTESDEEEYISGLTQKMAHSTLLDSGFRYSNTKGWSLSGSPQSTLNCPSQASSLPPVNRNDGVFDQFYAAAGEVARIRMEDAAGVHQTKTGLWYEKTSTVPVGPKSSNQNFGSFNSNQPSLSYPQLQVAQFKRLKQQIMKQGQVVFVSDKGGFGQYPVNQNQQQLGQSRAQNGVARPMNSSISGSGMRGVFLGNQGSKKECAGTGVFLPRRIGTTQTETRKKPGCSTVLLPDRVVQALNLNLEAMDIRQKNQVQARCYNDGSGLTPASGLKYPNNMAATTQQRRNVRTENTYSQPGSLSQELLLPSDWTY